ncbi:hypothetical protein AB0L57_30880 [Nocardia sp. NPDC052254]|uniref:hypothetical protein n=1 Tax=Nocardia sp. NPDC052254 TaxID=3155681 RepID=UPI00343D030D
MGAARWAGDLPDPLSHPFLVHAAQAHRGTNPKSMAQPPLELREEFELDRPAGEDVAVVAAIRRGLAG